MNSIDPESIEIHTSNLADALRLAIDTRSQWERNEGWCMKSALLAGWEYVLEAINKGLPVTIIKP